MVTAIPGDWRERCPLLEVEGWRQLQTVLEDPHAPRWNWPIGDRLEAADRAPVAAFRRSLEDASAAGDPAATLRSALPGLARRSALYRERLGPAPDPGQDWAALPTTCREDIARRLEDLVPHDVALERLIVYTSSGSSARPLEIPHHPAAVACHFVLLAALLARWGIAIPRRGMACWNLGAQAGAAVFATAITTWGGASFCKLSLHPRHWNRQDAQAFARRHPPAICSGDPAAFAELLDWDLPIAPCACVSSAAHLGLGLRRALQQRYGCAVIDSYATTETGPIAAEVPDGSGMALLAPDLLLEAVDGSGRPLPEGELGELCVSVLRNPYLPLLRYRTGDHGRLGRGPRGELRLLELQARALVQLRAADGAAICPADLARVIHRQPVLAFRCHQRRDGGFELSLRPPAGLGLDLPQLERELAPLLGGAALCCRIDPQLGRDGGKLEPFSCELRDHGGGSAGAD